MDVSSFAEKVVDVNQSEVGPALSSTTSEPSSVEEDRSYARAVSIINTECVDAQRNQPGRTTEAWLEEIGIYPIDLTRLNVIHIAGSKGKGSTAACTSAILQHVNPQARIGCFSSPSLVDIRERYLVNGEPVSEEAFASTFFKVWDCIYNSERPDKRKLVIPGWWIMLCLCCFQYYLDIGVDCLVLEVGVGGRTDATNVIPFPLVTAVTRLALEHTNILGNTITEIASHKGGIFKPGVPALTVPQVIQAEQALQEEALVRHSSSFTVIYPIVSVQKMSLGLKGDKQVCDINASLAVAICNTFLTSYRVPRAFLHYVEKEERLYFEAITGGIPRAAGSTLLTAPSMALNSWMIALLLGSSVLTVYWDSNPSTLSFGSFVRMPSLASITVLHRTLHVGPHAAMALLFAVACNIFFYAVQILQRGREVGPSRPILLTDVLPLGIVAPPSLPEAYARGLQLVRMPGRCQVIKAHEESITWMLDGAHTVDSLRLSADWFCQAQSKLPSSRRVLMFALTKGRTAGTLLPPLFFGAHSKLSFDVIIFTTTARRDEDFSSIHDIYDLDSLQHMKILWQALEKRSALPPAVVRVEHTVENAIERVKDLARVSVKNGGSTDVLVCGSLHLIGSLMDVCGFEVDYTCR